MPKTQSTKIRGCKKCGRTARKIPGSPLSMYVRDRISATEYFRLTNQKIRK